MTPDRDKAINQDHTFIFFHKKNRIFLHEFILSYIQYLFLNKQELYDEILREAIEEWLFDQSICELCIWHTLFLYAFALFVEE